MSTQLVPSVSIDNLVNQRAAVLERLTQACSLIQEAADIAQAASLGMPRMTASIDYGRHSNEVSIAAARIKTDSSGKPWTIERSPQADLDKTRQQRAKERESRAAEAPSAAPVKVEKKAAASKDAEKKAALPEKSVSEKIVETLVWVHRRNR